MQPNQTGLRYDLIARRQEGDSPAVDTTAPVSDQLTRRWSSLMSMLMQLFGNAATALKALFPFLDHVVTVIIIPLIVSTHRCDWPDLY